MELLWPHPVWDTAPKVLLGVDVMNVAVLAARLTVEVLVRVPSKLLPVVLPDQADPVVVHQVCNRIRPHAQGVKKV